LVSPPLSYFAFVALATVLYLGLVELIKGYFYRRHSMN